MIILGGLTRLTGSGLSIIDWHPFTGFLPPLNKEAWQKVFELYQLSPEYQKVNYGMSLEEFKHIFWLEYVHRLWGRIIGIAFVVPVFYAYKHPKIRSYIPKLIVIWVVGAGQGLVGWYMIKSGLVHDPYVSPYRLALHLALGLISFGALLWLALSLNQPCKSRSATSLPWGLISIFVLLSLTILYGALVAGMKAGLIYNTFPLMGERWVPEDAFAFNPLISNFYQNPATVQWIHRLLAFITFVGIWAFIRHEFHQRQRSTTLVSLQILGSLSLIQVMLGIITIMYQVPLISAILHQAMGVILFATVIAMLHQRLYAWKLFAFQKFEKSSATG
jgi:cytochrome c oxidase assembly protein subunit 15